MIAPANAVAAFFAAWALAELVCAICLWLLRLLSGVHYAPRDRFVLSSACRRFIGRLIAANGRGDTLELSPSLGWTVRPGAISRDGQIRIDSRGLRAPSVARPSSGRPRVGVAVFGDCLTLGGGVSDEESWPQQIERLAPDVEVLNFGVDGYGPDQMLLRYQESDALCADCRLVVLALASSNLYKTRNAFRPFYAYGHGLQLAKPRFTLRDGALELVANPLPDLADYRALLDDPALSLARLTALDDYGREAYASGPLDWLPSVRLAKTVTGVVRVQRSARHANGDYVADCEALRLTIAVIDAFCGRALERGAQPLLVLLPLASDLRRYRGAGVKTYRSLIQHCQVKKIDFVDALDAFGSHAPRALFDGIHYTPFANALVAGAVLTQLGSSEATRARSAR